jgi:HEAT repeat protein
LFGNLVQRVESGEDATAIVTAIGLTSNIQAIPILSEVAANPDACTSARLAAVRALGNYDSSQVYDVLNALSCEKDPAVREAVRQSLISISSEYVYDLFAQ